MQNERVKGYRTWIEIDSKALKANYEQFRSLIPKETKFAAIVKSNAYGHGFIDFSKELEKLGVDIIATDSISEALRLRKEGVKTPLMVLGYTLPEKIPDADHDNIAITISQFETLEKIEKMDLEKPLKVHIKVDTGMHRQGFLEEDTERLIKTLKKLSSKIEVVGLFMHFAAAGDLAHALFTEIQLKRTLIWKELFFKNGFTPIVHAAATSATIAYPASHLDMVRIGAGMYGMWPTSDLKEKFSNKFTLQPVLAWKAVVSEVKHIKKGEKIGYDLTEELARDSVIAVVPIGYWHGFARGLSGKGEVLVRGKKARVLGRVSMDMIVIDVTDIPGVAVEDVLTLLGKDGEEEVRLEEMAKILNSSRYEVITRLNPLIKKIYV